MDSMNEDHVLAVNMALLNLKQCITNKDSLPVFEELVKKSFFDDFHKKLIKKINFDQKVKNLTLFKNDELITFCNWKSFDNDFKNFNEVENNKEPDKNKHVIIDDKIPADEE
jgi:hypothetical protein